MLPVFRNFLKRHDRTVATRMLRYSKSYNSGSFLVKYCKLYKSDLATLLLCVQSPGAVSHTICAGGGVCDFASGFNATHTA